MDWIWIGVIISLILIELLSLNFTSIWFVISAIISFILLKCNQDYIVQVISFLVVGMILILIVRPKIIDKLLSVRDKIIHKITKKNKFINYLIPRELRTNNNEEKKSKKNK